MQLITKYGLFSKSVELCGFETGNGVSSGQVSIGRCYHGNGIQYYDEIITSHYQLP